MSKKTPIEKIGIDINIDENASVDASVDASDTDDESDINDDPDDAVNIDDEPVDDDEPDNTIDDPDDDRTIATADLETNSIADDLIKRDDDHDQDEFEIMDEEGIAIRTKKIGHKNVINIADDDRRSSNVLSQYEMAEIISIRADQISRDGIVLTNVVGLSDPIAMAKKELTDRKCPLILRRLMGVINKPIGMENNVLVYKQYEYFAKWDVNTMAFSVKY